MRMFVCLISFLITLPLSLFADSLFKRVNYGSGWDYQTILINGKEVYASDHLSGGSAVIYDRYRAMKPIFDQYTRPFSVLDLGANNGFFSLKITEDYPGSCAVMVDNSERLTDICALNTNLTKLVHLKKNLTAEELQTLAGKEHFDVVLALFILHHVDDWKKWVDTLFRLGDNVIIETPSENDPLNRKEKTVALARYLTSLPNAVVLGTFPRGDHLLWFCQNKDSFQKQKSKLGIFPSTFYKFNGRFPSQSYVKYRDKQIKEEFGSKSGWRIQGIDSSFD